MTRVNKGMVAVLSFCVAATAGAQGLAQERPTQSRQSKEITPATTAGAQGLDVEAKDTKLEKEVESRLEKDPVLKFQGLDATVMEGKVVLSGTTGSRAEKLKAAKLANGVKGVSRVENQILVRGSAEAASDPPTPDRPRTDRPAPRPRPGTIIEDEVEPARVPPPPVPDIGRGTPGRNDEALPPPL